MQQAGNPEDRLIVVGVITGAHGVRGDVRVKSFTDDPEALFDYGPLLSDTGEPLLEARSARPGKDHFIVSPRQAKQKEDWDALKGTRLHVPRSALPPPDGDEFYIEDLIGLAAIDTSGKTIGKVKAVQDYGAGDLLEILPARPGEPSFFVPFTLSDVPEINFTDGLITIADPDGWADQSDPRQSEPET